MKHFLSLFLCVLLVTLAACATTADQSAPVEHSASEREEGAAFPASEAEPKQAAVRALDGLEGNYVVVEDLRDNPEHASPGDYFYLADMLEFYGAVVLHWGVGNGLQGPALIDVVNPKTGESLFRRALEGYAYEVEDTGELPENYRAVMQDRILYLSSGDPAMETVYTLPEEVRSRVWSPEAAIAPYDYDRGSDTLAFGAEDGIYVANGDGGDARLILPAADLPAVMAGSRESSPGEMESYTLPEHQDGQLRYVAPLLMNGGRYVAATSYLTSGEEGNEPIYIGVSFANLETGEITHPPGRLTRLSGPARRRGGGELLAMGYGGPLFIRVQEGDNVATSVEYDEYRMESWTWDYERYFRVRDTAGGKKELLRYGRETPEDGDVLLTAGEQWEYLTIWAVGPDSILCALGNPEGESGLVLVPWRLRGSMPGEAAWQKKS